MYKIDREKLTKRAERLKFLAAESKTRQLSLEEATELADKVATGTKGTKLYYKGKLIYQSADKKS